MHIRSAAAAAAAAAAVLLGGAPAAVQWQRKVGVACRRRTTHRAACPVPGLRWAGGRLELHLRALFDPEDPVPLALTSEVARAAANDALGGRFPIDVIVADVARAAQTTQTTQTKQTEQTTGESRRTGESWKT